MHMVRLQLEKNPQSGAPVATIGYHDEIQYFK